VFHDKQEAYMDGIATLAVLVGVLCVSASLGLAFEWILVGSLFKFLPHRQTKGTFRTPGC
jgi:hypothetical protein